MTRTRTRVIQFCRLVNPEKLLNLFLLFVIPKQVLSTSTCWSLNQRFTLHLFSQSNHIYFIEQKIYGPLYKIKLDLHRNHQKMNIGQRIPSNTANRFTNLPPPKTCASVNLPDMNRMFLRW